MSIKIVSDSTCDLNKELLEKYDIRIIPLSVICEGQALVDGVDISPEDIVKHVEDGGNMCTTSAINEEIFFKEFTRLSPAYDAVIYISIGSDFSSCWQNAATAAKKFNNVYAIDSMNLTTGEGMLVLEAARMAQQGMDVKEIIARVEKMRDRVEASFILEQLSFLRKGGRCSSVAALGANLLRIKPCIKLKDGKMGVAEKYRGSFSKCMEEYIRERLEGREDLDTSLIFITYSPTDPAYPEQARVLIEKYAHFDQVITTRAGCTVTCHCGPNTLGIIFATKG